MLKIFYKRIVVDILLYSGDILKSFIDFFFRKEEWGMFLHCNRSVYVSVSYNARCASSYTSCKGKHYFQLP